MRTVGKRVRATIDDMCKVRRDSEVPVVSALARKLRAGMYVYVADRLGRPQPYKHRVRIALELRACASPSSGRPQSAVVHGTCIR